MPDPEKWYLNLAARYPDGTVKSRAGTRIKLTAKPSRAVRNSVNPQVDWTTSYADSPDAHHDYVVAPAFTIARTGLVEGQFKTDLDVPVVNGRTYTITANRTGNNAQVFTKQYVTWQRIYYTVHYMNNACRDAFNAIKNDLHTLFATANIELKLRAIKQCRKGGRNVNEEYTSTEAGVTLPQTWDATDAPLARQPHHIRMVVARDLTSSVNGEVEWTMSNLTTATPARKIRISSKGDNHGTVVYENEIATFDPAQPFSSVTVHAKLDPVPLPLACIAHDDPARPHGGLRIDLSADPSLAAVFHHFKNGIGVSLTGALDGRRCEQGWEHRYSHATTATLSAANDDSNPVTVGSARLWLAADKVVIDDPRMLLDAASFSESIKVRYAATTVNLDSNTAARTNENRVTIDLSGQAAVTTHLAGDAATIEISLSRRGTLARGDVIGATETVNFTIKNVDVVKGGSHNGVSLSYKSNTNTKILTVTSAKLAFVNPGDLTGDFVHLSVPIVVPPAAISATSPHHAEIDLAADDSLGLIATAMQDGRELTFKATLNGRESMGGYSPGNARWFIGLNTRSLGFTDAVVRRRLKLTIAHEIGHSLLLVKQTTRNLTTNTDLDNNLWYTNEHGGQGPHCHHNAHLVDAGAANGFEDTASGQLYRHDPLAGGKLCIMYHALDHENIGEQFCDRCLEHLKRGVANFGP